VLTEWKRIVYEFNLLLTSSLIKFELVIVFPNYFIFAIFSKNLLAIFILWFCSGPISEVLLIPILYVLLLYVIHIPPPQSNIIIKVYQNRMLFNMRMLCSWQLYCLNDNVCYSNIIIIIIIVVAGVVCIRAESVLGIGCWLQHFNKYMKDWFEIELLCGTR
jgi:hypothetical protein